MAGIVPGSQQVQRDVRLIANDGAVVASRDVEDVALPDREDAAVVHGDVGAPRKDDPHVLDVTAC